MYFSKRVYICRLYVQCGRKSKIEEREMMKKGKEKKRLMETMENEERRKRRGRVNRRRPPFKHEKTKDTVKRACPIS